MFATPMKFEVIGSIFLVIIRWYRFVAFLSFTRHKLFFSIVEIGKWQGEMCIYGSLLHQEMGDPMGYYLYILTARMGPSITKYVYKWSVLLNYGERIIIKLKISWSLFMSNCEPGHVLAHRPWHPCDTYTIMVD